MCEKRKKIIKNTNEYNLDNFFERKERTEIVSFSRKYISDFLFDKKIENQQYFNNLIKSKYKDSHVDYFISSCFELFAYNILKKNNINVIRNDDGGSTDKVPDFSIFIDRQEILSDALFINHLKSMNKFHYRVADKANKHRIHGKPMIPIVGAFERKMSEQDLKMFSDKLWHQPTHINGVCYCKDVLGVLLIEFDRLMNMGEVHFLECPKPIYNIDLSSLKNLKLEK